MFLTFSIKICRPKTNENLEKFCTNVCEYVTSALFPMNKRFNVAPWSMVTTDETRPIGHGFES